MKNNNSLWRDIIGHRDILSRLKKAINQKQVAHAYLFSGPKGVGKCSVALRFAAALSCELKDIDPNSSPCGQCVNCKTILKGTHRDTYLIQPEGNSITIGQIRDIRKLTQLKNYSSEYKVIIIDEADTMNKPAANCLLKIVEEPPGPVVFILIAANYEVLPLTVISRCRLVAFPRLQLSEIMNFLTAEFKLEPDSARTIAFLSRGIMAKALALSENNSFFKRREQIVETIAEIKETETARLSFLAEKLIKHIKKEASRLQEQQQKRAEAMVEQAANKAHAGRIRKELAKKDKRELVRLERSAFDDILASLNSIYRDALLLASGGDANLTANIDIIPGIARIAAATDIAGGLAAISHINQAKEMIRSNVSPALALEYLFFNLQEA